MNSTSTLPTARAVQPVAVVLIVSLILLGAGFVYRVCHPDSEFYKVESVQLSLWVGVPVIIAAALLVVLAVYLLHARRQLLDKYLEAHEKEIDKAKNEELTLYIVLSSALGIFAELIMIRTESSLLQMFAIFKNVTMLSCFLGLGIGYAQGRRWRLTTPLTLPLLTFLFLFFEALRIVDANMVLRAPVSDEVFWGIFNPEHNIDFVSSYGVLIFSFIVTTLCMVPLGQLASLFMEKKAKLDAYNWNLVGGIAGILLFSVLAMCWSPPAVWVAVLFLLLMPFLRGPGVLAMNTVCAVVMIVSLSIPFRPLHPDVYSPYQTVTLNLNPDCLSLSQNNVEFQRINDLSDNILQSHPDWRELWRDTYDLPYRFKAAPEDVMIIGAGAGNDVAAALRNGARHVDAVELDPAIVELGRHLHGERPYSQPGVQVHIEDARSFLRNSDKKYDMIVSGLVASSSSLSALTGGIRLDNFLYSADCYREARRHLKPGGLLIVSMRVFPPFDEKFFYTIQSAFDGNSPLAYEKEVPNDHVYIIGEKTPDKQTIPGFTEFSDRFAGKPATMAIATDDWPYMFMYQRTFPVSFLVVFAVLMALSVWLVKTFVPTMSEGFSLPCFFLGVGFMLIETKAITQLSLTFGSTWIVTAIVIAVIFALALAANMLVKRALRMPRWLVYASILGAICLSAYCTSNWDLKPDLSGKLLATLLATLPLFFSGLAFSTELKGARSLSAALCANLIGGMLGGLLEYSSMYFGYGMLYLLALQIYLLAFLVPIYLERRWRLDQNFDQIEGESSQRAEGTGEKEPVEKELVPGEIAARAQPTVREA